MNGIKVLVTHIIIGMSAYMLGIHSVDPTMPIWFAPFMWAVLLLNVFVRKDYKGN